MDLLVKLYEQDFSVQPKELFEQHKISIVRPLSPSKGTVCEFIEKNFSKQWADECGAAFSNLPATCFVALNENKEIVGFAAYEATCKAFFGPLGVKEDYRKFGIGKYLLRACLQGLKELGYAYAIIGGGSGKAEFYIKSCGATLIEGSEPGIYRDIF